MCPECPVSRGGDTTQHVDLWYKLYQASRVRQVEAFNEAMRRYLASRAYIGPTLESPSEPPQATQGD